MKKVILVNEQDEVTGEAEKMLAHRQGLLHRAYSVFILDTNRNMLLQKRAAMKYHSGGLWTNACCSHPQPGENILQSAESRLLAEMGFTTVLTPAFSFTYKAIFENGLTEHEYDHVLIGFYEGNISPDKDEVEDFAWMNFRAISEKIKNSPDSFTEWFKIAFPKVEQYLVSKDFI